ncbi:pimeloyl-ACP methyl ester carboxylesterase [Sphingomonas zeicaulis]|uniref:epoxide hydrolase family protein n=1 Tax=Sphingomonas zeicaulis TaxID=1632740 RepID=UPI003D1A6679
MRRRIAETRWADTQPVDDDGQGVRREALEPLMRYWAEAYDWRKVEARLNALPMFLTRVDGLDIHFLHIRSRHENALPMILTHGWPGSILEFLKVIAPLADPTAHGGKAEDAFHLVIPSIPGFGFSAKPTGPGWGSDRIGRAWATLMRRLGYDRYVSQGGDCGSVISQRMALQCVPGLIGIHLNMPAVVPAEIAHALAAGDSGPASLSAKERAAFDQLVAFYRDNSAYAAMMNTRPQTIGYALVDSPVGMAGWMYEKIGQWTYPAGDPERVLGRDTILDDLSLYWLTGTGASAARIYWEDHSNNFNARGIIDLPVAVSVFPGEIFRAPRSWAERCYTNLFYFNEARDGGHFAAWEKPGLFAEEVRAAFRPLR